MSFGQMRDIGAWLKTFLATLPEVITAGAGNDGVEVDGPWIPMQHDYTSGLLIIGWQADLADTETLTLAANVQDATDASGTGAADYDIADSVLASTVVATASGAQFITGTTVMHIPELNGNRGFLRAQVTATLSATSIDTVAIATFLVVGGMADLPDGPGGIQATAAS